jgi:hypothetical protein
MNLLEPIVGAVIAWLVPKLLDGLLRRAKREGAEATPLEKSFPWVKWCFSLAAGGAVGGFLSGVLGVLGLATPGGLGNWTAFGVAVGVSQWLVLSRYLAIGPFWAVFSALGWSVWSVVQAEQMSPYLGWSAVGLAVGILQWFILARVRRRAFWWIPANIVGWLIAGSVGWVVGLGLLQAGFSFPAAWVLGWGCVGAVGSVILGGALAWMPGKESGGAT